MICEFVFGLLQTVSFIVAAIKKKNVASHPSVRNAIHILTLPFYWFSGMSCFSSVWIPSVHNKSGALSPKTNVITPDTNSQPQPRERDKFTAAITFQ
jgi:hypothetical protein